VGRRQSDLVHTLYEGAVWLFGSLLFVALSLAWTGVALALSVLLPAAWSPRVGRWGITLGFRIFVAFLGLVRAYRIDLSGLDALRGEPAMIIASNHPSLLDAVLVTSRLPVTCIMKADLENNLFLGAGARFAGYIGNGSVHRMIDRSVAALKAGAHLLVFPEGTRTTRAPLNPLTGSIGIISRRAGVPVQTVLIDTDSPCLSKGWSLLRKPSLPITVRVRLGKRFDPPTRARDLVRELERYFAAEFAHDSLLQSWLPSANGTIGGDAEAGRRASFADNDGQALAHPPRPYSQL
jgi:1-acyl-sn-glycerol-3-phosphate acyltransferase